MLPGRMNIVLVSPACEGVSRIFRGCDEGV